MAMLLMAAMACVNLSACSDDDEGGSPGYWVPNVWEEKVNNYYSTINEIYGSGSSSEFDFTFTALAYHFVDGKTVERGALSVYATKKVGDTDENITDTYKSNFLLRKDIVVRGTDRDTIACCLYFNSPGTYTYSRKDDNIYISNGDVLIVDGNTLRMKGSSFIWVKVK